MARSDFRCLKCGRALGRRTSVGELIVKTPGTLVETTRSSTIIHCPYPCCHRMIANGPVKSEAPALVVQRTV